MSTRDALTGSPLYTFEYDAAGRLIRITDGDNNVTTISRNGNGAPTAITGPHGQTTTLTLDANGHLITVVNPANETHRMTYTLDGLLNQFTNPRQLSSNYTYDAVGRLTNARNPAGGGLDLGRQTQDQGYQITRRSVLGRTTTYQLGNMATGDRQRATNFADGTQTRVFSGANGNHKTTSPDGTVTERLEGPDPRFSMQSPIIQSLTTTTGDLTATLATQRTVQLSNPNDPLSLTSLTDTVTLNGRVSTSAYNAVARTLTNTSAAGRQTVTLTDTQRRPTRVQVSGIDAVSMSYDSLGRLSGMVQGDRTTTFSYNSAGYLNTITDPLNRTVTFEYDLAGRVTRQILPDSREILYAYDPNGNLTSLTPPGRPAHTFTYTNADLQGNYVPPAVPGGGNTLYSYNADKQLERTTRPDGETLDYAYDTAGRLKMLTIARGQYGYEYNSAGQLGRITDPDGGALNFTYQGALLTQVARTGAVSGNVGFSYDNDFRVKSITLNGANPIDYQYDADSLLIRAGDLQFSRNTQNGLLIGTTLGSTSDGLSYNSFGEVSRYSAGYNNSPLLTIDYTRDKLGRIIQKVETVGGVTTTYDYRYDAIGQLIEVKQNGSVVASYSYDTNGNRLSKAAGGTTVNGTYDAQDRLLSYGNATYTYTANGELQTKTANNQTTSYNYDALGNLRQVTLPNGTQIEYLIDGQNRRVGKKVNGVLVQGFLYQGQLRPAAELDGSGAIVSRFVYGKGINVPDYMVKGGVTYRIIADHLGSPRLIVNTATGAIAQRMDYDEFGDVLLDTNSGFQPFGFAGGIYDKDTGLLHFRARDYDPRIGRWTAKDPIRFAGGDLNLYTYVNGNPLSFTDPLGLAGLVEVMTQIGAVGLFDADTAGQLADESQAEAAKSGLPGLHNGPADAYRHCLWSCQMTKAIGASQAEEVGNIHEKYGENPPGEICMDLHNNAQGRNAASGTDCAASCRGLLTGGNLQTSPGGTPPSNLY